MKSILLFNMPNGFEWIIILLALLLLFGGKKIPELIRGIGRGIREFKEAKKGKSEEIEPEMNKEE